MIRLADYSSTGPMTIVPYRTGDRCPFCWHQNFYIHRATAECACCEVSIPMDLQRPFELEVVRKGVGRG